MGGTPTVATELSREDGATIVLTGVTRDSVAEGDLSDVLRARHPPVRGGLVNSPRAGQLFVVIAVLASRVLHVETSKKVAARIETSIPITAGVAPKIEPSGGSTGTVTLAWDGETPCHSASRPCKWSIGTASGSRPDAAGQIAYAAEPDANTVRQLLILDDDLVEVDVETQSQ